jgi:hypothetical protein
MKIKLIFLALLAASAILNADAQSKAKYSYLSQKQNIPIELGKVYLGMPFAAFAKQINLKDARVNNRFEWLECTPPFVKGNVVGISFKVSGLSEDAAAKMIHKVTRPGNTENGDEYEEEVQMIDPAKISAKTNGIVYEISVRYKKGFDLKAQALKMFGPAKEKDIYKKGDEFHIFDIQWTKKTSDGLTTLIRYYQETNSIMLAGIIDKTEWDPNA